MTKVDGATARAVVPLRIGGRGIEVLFESYMIECIHADGRLSREIALDGVGLFIKIQQELAALLLLTS